MGITERELALMEALIECKAQAHFFLCYEINRKAGPTDDGTCEARHCVMAREALAMGPPKTVPYPDVPATDVPYSGNTPLPNCVADIEPEKP